MTTTAEELQKRLIWDGCGCGHPFTSHATDYSANGPQRRAGSCRNGCGCTQFDETTAALAVTAKVYLSGVISLGGTLSDAEIQANLQRFADVTTRLRAQGVTVVDPTEIAPRVDEPTWCDYMRADLKALLDCDAILMLPGWSLSKGSRLERHIAEQLGLRVAEIDAGSTS